MLSDLAKIPSKSWNAILNMARGHLHLKKNNRWSIQKQRDILMSKMFLEQNLTISEIAVKLSIPCDLVYKRMHNLGIKQRGRKVTNKMCKILEDTPVSSYWLGFILADGSFPKHKSKIRHFSFWLSKKDEITVRKFASFLGISNIREQPKQNAIGFTANDIKTIRELYKKIGLSEDKPKTYCPPTNLRLLSPLCFFSLIIGYIDGDGCITNVSKTDRTRMAVVAHKSWTKIFDSFDTFLYSYFKILRMSNADPVIDSNGYALWAIRDNELLKSIKKEIIRLELPVMSRKWDKIDLDLVTKKDVINHRKRTNKSMCVPIDQSQPMYP